MVEVKKLRELGLHPTRVFTRDDGMVIDWYVPIACCGAEELWDTQNVLSGRHL